MFDPSQDMSFGGYDDIQKPQVEPVPAGPYNLRAVGIEWLDTQAGGKRLSVQFEIIDGPFAGRKVFDSFNLVHPTSVDAVEIGRGLCKAWRESCGAPLVGEMTLSSLFELEGAPFSAKVKIESDPGYDPKNRIDRFLPPAQGSAQATPSQGAAPSATPPAPPAPAAAPGAGQAGGASPRPWENGS